MDYDIRAQTRAVIENIKAILEDAGSSLEKVVDCLSFLVDMDRDFSGYNEVYAEYFSDIQCARTTVAIRALPTPIAVELGSSPAADSLLSGTANVSCNRSQDRNCQLH